MRILRSTIYSQPLLPVHKENHRVPFNTRKRRVVEVGIHKELAVNRYLLGFSYERQKTQTKPKYTFSHFNAIG
jgi:hypothetical protein